MKRLQPLGFGLAGGLYEWRAILDEMLGFRPDFIEHQLAHAVKDPNGRIMAMIFKSYRPRVARKMLAAACEDDDKNLKQWLYRATFAKTSNRYWLA
ncbi:MAG: hypothetical protein PHG00_10095 [Methylococcales bacterium]|nr:hypothetical protein [Methylococcales bacterium]